MSQIVESDSVSMLTPKELLDIICTEAIEFGGLQEVPDDKHGATQNYHARKRDARGAESHHEPTSPGELPPIELHLILRQNPDGTLEWLD